MCIPQNMQRDKVKTASSLWKPITSQWPSNSEEMCNTEIVNHFPNYATIIEDMYLVHQGYNIISYPTLLNTLNKQLPCAFLNETNSSLLTNLKPLIFDPRYANRTKNIAGCVTYSIYCKFPFQCILSHPSEPLLARIKAYYDVLLGIFKNALPGNRKNLRSILNQNGTQGQFQISRPGCYKYAECYGMELNPGYWLEIPKTVLKEMRNKEREILEQPFFQKYKSGEHCGKLVFMCNAEGDCTTLLLSELYQEVERGINYFEKRIKPFHTLYRANEILEEYKPFKYSSNQTCNNLHIYSDNKGIFAFSPNATTIKPFFGRYYVIFESLTSLLFQPLIDINEGEFCHNGHCLEISFVERATNRTKPKKKKLKSTRYPDPPRPIRFPANRTSMLLNTNSDVFHCSANHPTLQVASSSAGGIVVLTFLVIISLIVLALSSSLAKRNQLKTLNIE